MLVKKASGLNYSIEAGVHDGIRNFDHHPGIAGAEGQPCPARNASIPKIIGVANHIVEISHIDADTLLGIWRMAGFNDPTSDWLGWLDLKMLEQIDLNGTSGVPPCDTLFFVIGVSEIAKSLGFPRVADEPQDVTPIVREMIGRKSFADFVAAGQTAHARSEAAYRTCRQGISPNGKVGFWAIGKDDPLDPSRPYQDGVGVVVVYRSHYQSVSIYCDPTSQYAFGGKEVGGIMFAGHPKACGSPPGHYL